MKRKLKYFENKIKDLSLLLNISSKINSKLDIHELLDLIMSLVKENLNVEACSLLLLDRNKEELYFEVALGEKGEEIKRYSIKVGEGIAGKVAETGIPIIENRVETNPLFNPKFDFLTSFKTKALICVPLVHQGEIIGVMEVINKKDNKKFTKSDLKLLQAISNQASIAIKNALLYQDLKTLFFDTIESLVSAIDAKDPYTHGHSKRVSEIAILIAKEIDNSTDFIEKVRLSGLLHDIGKIGIEESILTKKGKLTLEEIEIIKKHPTIGKKILEPIDLLREILPGVEEHHEKYDGSGYPKGLKGENISLLGRIISVADVFDALTSDRPYRKGLDVHSALLEINSLSGVHFDPYIVNILNSLYQRGKLFCFGS
ncbi:MULTISPECIES: HD-GYP domain-containing protein [Dictyoglomus]|jgi:putative nucleotidyltransferase with HDIG domain|uniref:Metal dependent phosphohydrolase n=1 Tax=Dictyoglomus turgidum (strain DSM 6724 / Z-1310) TaxID=515635 RepID=B8E2Z6_DICTD|nr:MULTISPECIES: HD-GYP domain-containing protein [Dictyoglomus]ACK42496.1 metal dependent phosphohydrolase [Dictyoglomus turgidum DSM 6724]HBU32047.1 HD-GYP domain-containing protein [Dictyoglomus sp.]